jgi:hypothetical protein
LTFNNQRAKAALVADQRSTAWPAARVTLKEALASDQADDLIKNIEFEFDQLVDILKKSRETLALDGAEVDAMVKLAKWVAQGRRHP